MNITSVTSHSEMIGFLGVPSFLLRVNVNGEIVYSACNQEWFEETGRTADQVLGKTAKEIYKGELGVECYQKHLQAASAGEKISYDLKLPILGRISWGLPSIGHLSLKRWPLLIIWRRSPTRLRSLSQWPRMICARL